jgi:serine/threonine-protein kinase
VKAVGYLSVDATPWAQVYVDGRLVGETPIDRFPLPPSEVTVKLVNPELSRSVTRRVKVAAGQRVLVREEL